MGSTLLRRPTTTLLILCIALGGLAERVFGQDTQAPSHAAVVDGTVMLDREDTSAPLTSGMPFVPGDRIRTTQGRAEFLFPDGSALDLDENTTIELKDTALLAMTSGRVLLTVAGALDPGRAVRYHIDGPAASVQTESAGEYRLAVTSTAGDMELAVLRGAASFFGDTGSMLVRAGEVSVAREGYAPTSPQLFNAARMDAFDRWAADRRNERLGSVSSTQYLPSDLRTYGATFDQNGTWAYESSYGYVWYPTVAVGWRPYYYGYWASVPHYGWTWVGYDTWGWPTHHYGRWGYGHNSRWFWVPDRRYAPAYVTWASAPGYVGWCPLGFDNRPVFGLSVGVATTWVGWTVLPQRQFGAAGVYVNHAALTPRQIPAAQFVPHVSAPIPARIPHAALPAVAGAAVPRSGNTPSTANRPGPAPDTGTSSAYVATRVPPGGARGSTTHNRSDPPLQGQAIAAPFVPSTAPRPPALPRYPSPQAGVAPDAPGTIIVNPRPGYDGSRAVSRPVMPGQNPPARGPSSAPGAAPAPGQPGAPTPPPRGSWGASPPASTSSIVNGFATRAVPRTAPIPAAPPAAGAPSALVPTTPTTPMRVAPTPAVARPAVPTTAAAPAPAPAATAGPTTAPPSTATAGQASGTASAAPAPARSSHRSR
jgi:hypothetical protein